MKEADTRIGQRRVLDIITYVLFSYHQIIEIYKEGRKKTRERPNMKVNMNYLLLIFYVPFQKPA